MTTSEPALALDGVVAGYGGGDVLRGVTFDVPEGEITCVVGPNGAGKSTLMRVISGLLKPGRGSVTLKGEKLHGRSARHILASGVVQVPQNHSLFMDMTVRENIDLGGYILRDRGAVASRMDAVFDQFPQVKEWADRRAGALSGGQQRLVEFARALMLDPVLILLDEPSMGLSPATAKSVFGAMRQLNAAGTTILLVEQNARAGLRLAHHGVVMENGTVRLAGSGREVLEHPEIGELYLGGTVRPDRPGIRKLPLCGKIPMKRHESSDRYFSDIVPAGQSKSQQCIYRDSCARRPEPVTAPVLPGTGNSACAVGFLLEKLFNYSFLPSRIGQWGITGAAGRDSAPSTEAAMAGPGT